MAKIDWSRLKETAELALNKSYAPYSNYNVGCAGLTDDGRIVEGCNIENASYGITMCAENSMIADMFLTGGGKLVAFICLNGDKEVIMPCGRCRQLLNEHASKEFTMQTPNGIMTMEQILPLAFSRENL